MFFSKKRCLFVSLCILLISKCFRFIPNKRIRSKLFSNRFKLFEYYFFSSKIFTIFNFQFVWHFFKASNWVKMFRSLFDIVSDLLKNHLHVCTLCQTSFRWFQVIAEFENESNHFVTFSSSSRSFQTCFRQSRCFQVFFFREETCWGKNGILPPKKTGKWC